MSVSLSNQELIPLLKVNGNGWHVAFFEDQQTVSREYLCENCNSVCCDPVELGCDHEDDDIYLFCNECLKDLIENNNSKCLLNSHSNPIIIANRTIRRKISKSIVNCPYSVRYQLQQMNNNKNNGKAQIYDTINNYNDEKEGANQKNDDHKINGCEWSGKLNDILTTNHLNQCVQKYDKSFVLKMSLNKLQNEKIKLNQIINDQKQQINDKNRQTHELQQKNEKQSEQINKLNAELKQQSILVQDLMDEAMPPPLCQVHDEELKASHHSNSTVSSMASYQSDKEVHLQYLTAWDKQEVCSWLESNKYSGAVIQIFWSHDIDGKALIKLSSNAIFQMFARTNVVTNQEKKELIVSISNLLKNGTPF